MSHYSTARSVFPNTKFLVEDIQSYPGYPLMYNPKKKNNPNVVLFQSITEIFVHTGNNQDNNSDKPFPTNQAICPQCLSLSPWAGTLWKREKSKIQLNNGATPEPKRVKHEPNLSGGRLILTGTPTWAGLERTQGAGQPQISIFDS